MRKAIIFLLILCVAGTSVAFGQTEKTLKRKVAIGRFTNETQYAKGLFYDRDNDPIRKQALDILSAKLAASGKFILLERDGLEELVAEAGADMQKIGADYIILGSVTKFGRKVEGDQKVFSQSKTQTVEAGVSIRLVEVSTGLIIYSDEASGFAETTSKQTLGIGGTAGYDATLSDKAISAALSQLYERQSPESVCELVCLYAEMIEKPGGVREVVPPGIYAEYGYLLLQPETAEAFEKHATDKQKRMFGYTDYGVSFHELGIAMLQKEIELYPEAEKFIGPLLKRLKG